MEPARDVTTRGSASPAPLRVALVGYGLAGAAFHAPPIEATDGLALAAIVTRDPQRSAEARSRHADATILPHVDELWRIAERIDVAVIATPNATHVPLALAALDAGLHVVVDKPLAATADDARRLIERAAMRRRVLTVYHNRRWDGDFLTLRRLIEAGDLGAVCRFESRFERWRPVPRAGWRQDPDPRQAGGLLFDLGPHLIDQALLLFGPVRDVYAELERRRPGSLVDDDAFVALAHESGVRSHLWMNLLAARPAPRFRVLGTRATWTKHGVEVQEEQLRGGIAPGGADYGKEPEERWGTLYDGERSTSTPALPGDYAGFYAALVRTVRDGAPPPVDPVDALAGLEIIEAARRASGAAAGT